MPDVLLSTYLNDHLAASLVAVELARRAAANNRDTPAGKRLEELVAELEQDRETLQRAMERLGVGKDRAKLVLGWTAEKLGRLKLNGRLVGYSPLSRVEELELLALGVEGKLLLWQGLAQTGPGAQAELPFDELIARARSQLRLLRRLRLEAVRAALGEPATPPAGGPRARGSAPTR